MSDTQYSQNTLSKKYFESIDNRFAKIHAKFVS